MTHLHLSTLGQCLISLARQGIKDPLYRVLRFVQAGAVVSSQRNFASHTHDDSMLTYNTNNKNCLSPKPIVTDQVKVSFQKATNILDQINEIQQQPDITPSKVEQGASSNMYLPNYSTEEQCKDIQKIVEFESPLESYLKQQLDQLTDHLELLKNHDVNHSYLNQVEEEVQFLKFANQLCHYDYQSIENQGQIDEFARLQNDIATNTIGLSDPAQILQIMKEFNLSYFESDKCFRLHQQNLSLALDFLRKLFYTPPKSFFKIDEMD